MNRREVIGGLVVPLLPAVAIAQQERIYRVALVAPSGSISELSETGSSRPFFQELRRLGYVEGRNLVVLRYTGEGRVAGYDEMVRSVVRSDPDVIVTFSARLVRLFKAETSTIPIVASTADPVALGVAASLSRPGGNYTGVTNDAGHEINGKRLALLKEAIPRLSRVGYLATPYVWESSFGAASREAAARLGVELVIGSTEGQQEAEYRSAFDTMLRQGAEALLVTSQPEFFDKRRLIVQLAEDASLPSIYAYRGYAEIGGLLAYAVDLADISRRLAGYVAQILRGAKPADMPIFQATKFELIINLKAAKKLGLAIPAPLLARADEVIE